GFLAFLPGFPLAPLAGFAFAPALAFLPFFAPVLALLVRFGAVVAVSAALPPSRLWIAFQIRLTADFWFANFLTGVTPGMPFQISTSRSAGHSASDRPGPAGC